MNDWQPDVTRRVYELLPPLDGHRWVAVSDSTFYGLDETMIFPCSRDGSIDNWCEIIQVRPRNHIKALDQLGYTIAPVPSEAEDEV